MKNTEGITLTTKLQLEVLHHSDGKQPYQKLMKLMKVHSIARSDMDANQTPAARNLCRFCYDLVRYKDPESSVVPPFSRSHHLTWIDLIQSSQSCILCRSINSWWGRKTLDKELNQEEYKSSKDRYEVSIATLATKKMLSGVEWGFHEASLISINTPRKWLSYFTTISSKKSRFRQDSPVYSSLTRESCAS